MNNSVKPGDLWLVLGNDPPTRDGGVFYLVREAVRATGEVVSVHADAFSSFEKSLTVDILTLVHLKDDRKVTDPKEKAYWLLKLENERNKND